MKRYSVLFVVLVMLLSISSAAMARIFFDQNGCPSFGPGCFPTRPDGYLPFKMQQGWYDNELVWFISTDTNNVSFAQDNHLTLAPKLSSGLGTDAVDEIYIVVNPACTQGPIFGSAPPEPDYTPIWHVNYITWNDIRLARPITNEDPASPDNPNGIPGPDLVTVTSTDIVFDCPIMARGPLGGPWFPAPPGSYRIPQGRVCDNYIRTKRIFLPFWLACCQNELTRKISKVAVFIPDSADPALASILGANFAPALAGFPTDDTQRFWYFPNSTISCQQPTEEWCPTKNSFRNTQFNYSPIELALAMDRSAIPPCSTICGRDQVLFLQDRGLLDQIGCSVINSPIKVIKCPKRPMPPADTFLSEEYFVD